MCGIVGYLGEQRAQPILVNGLKCLEYRGYDSAGISVMEPGKVIQTARAKGKLKHLEERLAQSPLDGSRGIGHTRWATHGKPSESNAHPHAGSKVSVVHNGIIENHRALRAFLTEHGATFASETDTEIIPKLIEHHMAEGLSFLDATRSVLKALEGAFAFVAMSEDDPNDMLVAKNASPLIIGLGEGETFVASDIPALLEHTRKVVILEDGQMARLWPDGVEVFDFYGNTVEPEVRTITWSRIAAEKEGHKHFMHKEIYEQPRAVADTLRGRVAPDFSGVDLDGFDASEVEGLKRLVVLACGTSLHAALVAKYWIERLARVPVDVEIASEYRYRDPILSQGDWVLAVSQSGETADTLAALEVCKSKGAKVMSICNVVDSSIARASNAVFYTHAGPEIGVASTKAFTTQLAVLALLSVVIADAKRMLADDDRSQILETLMKLPHVMDDFLKSDHGVEDVAKLFLSAKSSLFLGRGVGFPLALEGALKLKEISYIHAEGYPAGEMKHGPIALIESTVPVVGIVTSDQDRAKILSNLNEVASRDGQLVIIDAQPCAETQAMAKAVIRVPNTHSMFQGIVDVLPLQLLSYHVADRMGHDVDQPRNLAKSVTVE